MSFKRKTASASPRTTELARQIEDAAELLLKLRDEILGEGPELTDAEIDKLKDHLDDSMRDCKELAVYLRYTYYPLGGRRHVDVDYIFNRLTRER